MVTEVEDLQVLLASVKKSCPMPYFNASGLQDRAKRTVLLCQVPVYYILLETSLSQEMLKVEVHPRIKIIMLCNRKVAILKNVFLHEIH